MRRLVIALVLLLGALSARAVEVQAAKAFTVTARQFTYECSPSPFTVAQGDSVTITLTAADDGAGDGHGFFLEQYAEELNIVRSGQSRTIQFVATVVGQFTYFCTQFCGEGHTTMAGTFTVLPSDVPAPVVTSFSPSRGPTTGGNSVTVDGSGFQNGATVLFGEELSPSVMVSSSSRLVATAPSQQAGSVVITVVNPDLRSGTSSQSYTYESSGAAVTVTGVTPSSGSTAGGTAITISGSGFEPGAIVTIGGLRVPGVVVVNPTTINATTPVGPVDIETTSPRDVVVTNPNGTFARLPAGFTWILPPLAITLILPVTGPVTGGTDVTITGAGFSTLRPPSVLFGGTLATNVVIINSVTLTALTPKTINAGAVDVVVRRGSESATLAGAFTYEFVPHPRRRAVRTAAAPAPGPAPGDRETARAESRALRARSYAASRPGSR